MGRRSRLFRVKALVVQAFLLLCPIEAFGVVGGWCSSTSLSSSCEVVFVVVRSRGFLSFSCLVSRMGGKIVPGSSEVIDVFYRFEHGGLVTVWWPSFCESSSAAFLPV